MTPQLTPMYLASVEHNPQAQGVRAELIRVLRAAGQEVPQILHLFAFKPGTSVHLDRFTHAVMRGPSPLGPGMRELIAAFTSARNHCPF